MSHIWQCVQGAHCQSHANLPTRSTLSTSVLPRSWNSQRFRIPTWTDPAHQARMNFPLLQTTPTKTKQLSTRTASKTLPTLRQQSPATHPRPASPLGFRHGIPTRIRGLAEEVEELQQTESRSRQQRQDSLRIHECRDHLLLFEPPRIRMPQLEDLLNSQTPYRHAQGLLPICDLHGGIRMPNIELRRKPTSSEFGRILQIG